MKAFVFPGQGSQRKGMGSGLFERFPRQVEMADDILGYSLARLCLEDPNNQLNSTTFTQPAVYVVAYLNYLAALDAGARPDMVAGHSVGEYAALVAAGVFDFELGLRLVQERARAMATIEGGGLAAVVGLGCADVQMLIEQSSIPDLAIANINSPRQIVVGGPRAGLDAFVRYCADRSCRAVPLRVSGPFHTRHMTAAVRPYRKLLESCDGHFAKPLIPVFSNLTAEPHRREELVDTLSRHLSEPVQWQRMIEHMLRRGVRDFVEMGSPPILAAMIGDIRERFSIAEPNQATPPSRTAALFTERSGCTRPLLVGPISPAIAEEALMGQLASSGTMAILDTRELSLEELRALLEQRSASCQAGGNFGVTLSPYLPLAAQLSLLAPTVVRCILVPSELSCTEPFAAQGHTHPAPMLITQVESSESLEIAYQYADAVLVQLDRGANRGGGLGLLFEALRYRDSNLAQRKLLVGVSGIFGNPASIQAFQGLGADFAILDSAVLITEEAALEKDVKTRLRSATLSSHRLLPDAEFPEFASKSEFYVLEEAAAQELESLQNLFLTHARLECSDNRVSFSEAPGGSVDPYPDRAAVHERMKTIRERSLIRGDASLWALNRLIANQMPTAAASLPLATLLDLLSPNAH